MENNNKKALFIGLTTIDVQHVVDHFPQPNTKIKGEMPLVTVGGPATNAAITAARLGLDCTLLTRFGSNVFSSLVESEFKRYGVRLIDMDSGKVRNPLVASIITVTSTGDRTIFTHHPEGVGKETGRTLPIKISGFDLVFTDGFYPELAIPLTQAAQLHSIPVIFDGGSWKSHLPGLLANVNTAICSNDFRPPGMANPPEIFAYIKLLGISRMAITRGRDAILWTEGDRTGELPVAQVQAIDTLGAGDVFHGAYCYFSLTETCFETVLTNAARVASFSVGYLGTRQWMDFFPADWCDGLDFVVN